MSEPDAIVTAGQKRALLQRLLMPWWTLVFPLLGLLAIAVSLYKTGTVGVVVAAFILFGCVLSAVHQAEVVAHRVGEPFGTLVLAVAVTVIEVSLIVSLMLSDAGDASSLARDTVFAAIMIILNGIVGLCLLAGGFQHGEQRFSLRGASSSLNVLTAMVVLSLVLPNYVSSAPGPTYATSQLIFVAIVSVILYGTFVMVQTVRHRDYFLPDGDVDGDGEPDAHAAPPSAQRTAVSGALLLASLFAVVLLAKALSPVIGALLADWGAPPAVLGVLIAALILAPEGLAAVRAAKADRLQTSLNLALGSALATIGLTIPAVAVLSIVTDLPISLGLDAKSAVLLFLSLIVASQTLANGRTTVLQGAIHLMLFAVYLFTTFVP
jgi:Ca2+:H+ antiporter